MVVAWEVHVLTAISARSRKERHEGTVWAGSVRTDPRFVGTCWGSNEGHGLGLGFFAWALGNEIKFSDGTPCQKNPIGPPQFPMMDV